MAVDTPAKIAILGAGPIGLEAALYARFLGYEVKVFEIHEVANRIQAWEDETMLTPFEQNSSSLGLAAIAAHDEGYRAPEGSAVLTCGEWFQRYLKPLSQTDLIADSLKLEVDVAMIGKVEISKIDVPTGDYDRGAWDFRLLTQHLKRLDEDNPWPRWQEVTTADVVLDCGGRSAGLIGHGGVAVPNEGRLRFQRISYDSRCLPQYIGKSVLIVGDEMPAAWIVKRLHGTGGPKSKTRITWVTRRSREECPDGPFTHVNQDRLPARHALLSSANEIALSGSSIDWLPGTWIEAAVECEDETLEVHVSGETEGTIRVDHIVSQTSYVPERNVLTSELQLDICPITDAPRPFSEYLLKRPSPYSVEYPAPDPSALITSEPNYYVLGSKSFGRMPGFLFQHGLRQIRDVFTIIGDRADLDLYSQMK